MQPAIRHGIGKGKAGPGRPKGLSNKNTRDIMRLAQVHGPEAIDKIHKLMKDQSPGVRLAACREMLDCAYGRAPQAVDPKALGGITVTLNTMTGAIL